MGLPARPDVVLRIPRAIYVGETVMLEVEVTATKETKVDFIDVKLRGRQGWAYGSNESGVAVSHDVPSLASRVMDAGTLEVGTRTFGVSFTLPPGTAPSHQIAPAYARLLVDVHVSIPWWRDGRYAFVASVRIPPPANVVRTPLVSRQPFEAKAGEPRIELALASSTLVPGEAVVGSCALFHVDDSSPRELVVSFEPRVRLLGHRRPYEQVGTGYAATITLDAGSAGQAVPFRVRLPVEMVPSFKTATHEIAWFMRVALPGLFRSKLAIVVPIQIVDRRAADVLPKLTLAPRVADQRVVAAFERFALSRSLTVVRDEHESYPDEQPSLVREIGDSMIRIGYTYRGKAGTFLVGRIVYPRLGLGLAVSPTSRVRDLLSSDIEVGASAWDRAHHVAARDPDQVVAYLRGALPPETLGVLARWGDDELVVERNVASVEETDLESLTDGLVSQLSTLEVARTRIVPPQGASVDVAAWRELAERLHGSLTVGDLSITGKLDAVPVEVGLVFDVDHWPTASRVHVGDPAVASGAARELAFSLPSPAASAAEAPSERLRAVLASWPAAIRDLELRDGVAAASLPLDAGGTDPAQVRELARTLRALLAALDETAGPYR